ncbi:hypothetical protein SAMN05216428_102324 [Nitrosospira sp. Nsp11]|uniref:hypothetical protein n=1 Tax=Nitrosospira sp. Nsp11 TaxID=1855338 RepID=UPI000910FD34|nr:hypothetical protein [Nitrosospira sp. Nsp11]SHL41326.1 hypothetical protein SAMN05216428_102324 [Nitrosospira sp. Nsp11]
MNARQISEAVNAMQKARTLLAQSELPYDGQMVGVITDLANSEMVFKMELARVDVRVEVPQ